MQPGDKVRIVRGNGAFTPTSVIGRAQGKIGTFLHRDYMPAWNLIEVDMDGVRRTLWLMNTEIEPFDLDEVSDA